MDLTVTITGICAIVPTDGGTKAFLLMPNARVVGNEHAAGTHLPGHIPFVQWKDSRITLTDDEGLTQFKCVSSSLFDQDETTVVILADDKSRMGILVEIVDANNLPVTLPPFNLDLTGIVDMTQVLPESAIDEALVSSFDPDPRRVAVRMRVNGGSIAARHVPRARGTSSFKPRLGKTTYTGDFVQEVEWRLTNLNPGVYKLRRRSLGTTPGSVETFIEIDASNGVDVGFVLGNTPFEDILETGIERTDPLDHHFALFYKLLDVEPATQSFPVLGNAPDRESHSGGSNCPPAVIPGK